MLREGDEALYDRVQLALFTMQLTMPRPTRPSPIALALLATLPWLVAAQSPPDPADAFFDDTVIHEVRLRVNSRDLQRLKDSQDDTYYPANFHWGDQVVRNVGVRTRGLGSRRANKPGLRVDFNRYTSGQLFLGLRSFILRNNSQDASNMRERLSMLFFRNLGVAAVREAHTRLFVNDEYFGLYTIVESPDTDWLQKNLGENTGHLYEYSYDFEGAEAGTPFVFQHLGPDPASYVPILFTPQTREDDPQGEVLARFMEAINDTGAAWRTTIAPFLDLQPFIRLLAIENFLAEEDGLTGDYSPNNFYLYRFTDTTRFQFLPWDKSQAFWATDYSIFRNIRDGPEEKRNRLVLRAFEEPDLLQLYLDTLLECATFAVQGRTATQPGWLEAEVGRVYDQIREAALADTLLFTNAEFEQAVLELMAFARDRSAAVSAQVAAERGR